MSKVGIIEYDKLAIGQDLMRNNTFLREWRCPLPSLTNGLFMFSGCENLESFSSDLSGLTHGTRMFSSCYNLTAFSPELPSLTHGEYMFWHCSKLTSFSFDLPNLMEGKFMFCLTNLNSFSSELPSLTDGTSMFASCYNLPAFSSDLPNLTKGTNMFYCCTSLPKFKGVLNYLTNASGMFNGCTSLVNIGDYPFDTINNGGLYANSLETANDMFKNCTNLETLHFDVGTIKDINNLGLDTCSNLQHVSMALGSLTTAPTCFQGKTNLTSVNLNVSNLTSADQMFEGCNSLDTVTIKLKNLESANSMFKNCGNLKNLNLEYYSNSPYGGIDCREMFNGCDFRSLNLQVSLTNTNASSKHFIVGDGRRMFGYPEERDSNGNLTSNFVLNGEQWGKLIAGGWWLLGANSTRGVIFEATVDSNIMVPQSDGSIWCSATYLFRCGFQYFRIKYKDSNNNPVVVYGQSNMEGEYSLEKPVGTVWTNVIDNLDITWIDR